MSDPQWSAGDVGGIFAGAVALLATIGGGIRWLLGWKERRAQTLHAKLLKWEEKLEEREAKLDAEQASHLASIEKRIDKLEQQNEVLRNGYQLVATELRLMDPGNERLRQADELLRSSFPLYPVVPPDMRSMLDRLPGGERP